MYVIVNRSTTRDRKWGDPCNLETSMLYFHYHISLKFVDCKAISVRRLVQSTLYNKILNTIRDWIQ